MHVAVLARNVVFGNVCHEKADLSLYEADEGRA